MAIREEILDELLAGYSKPEDMLELVSKMPCDLNLWGIN